MNWERFKTTREDVVRSTVYLGSIVAMSLGASYFLSHDTSGSEFKDDRSTSQTDELQTVDSEIGPNDTFELSIEEGVATFLLSAGSAAFALSVLDERRVKASLK